jgi:hypothetical protein
LAQLGPRGKRVEEKEKEKKKKKNKKQRRKETKGVNPDLKIDELVK